MLYSNYFIIIINYSLLMSRDHLWRKTKLRKNLREFSKTDLTNRTDPEPALKKEEHINFLNEH